MIGVDILKKTVLPVSFFFGANNKSGYCSLYNSLYDPYIEGKHFILKGGPGTGKSTLMRKVAEKAERKGYYVEEQKSDLCKFNRLMFPGICVRSCIYGRSYT